MPLEGDLREVGEVLTGESLRLERLVDDLLDLARLQADRFRVDLAEADVADLVAETGRAWQERCRSAGVPFEVANEARGRVVTDAARVRQVLDGLLENALRMTPSGAPLVLASSVVGDEVLLEVRDGGPGLAPEDLADAFRPGVLHERYRGVRPVRHRPRAGHRRRPRRPPGRDDRGRRRPRGRRPVHGAPAAGLTTR